jgi:potassium efflux system protein
LILLIERPIQVGDLVQIGTLVAQVQRIGIRSSLVRTGDGAEVIVPNSKLVTNEVTNWTLSDRTRRIDVPVVVAYGADPERVLRVLREVVTKHPSVLQKPEPSALLVGFGERGLTFSVGVWVAVFERWPAVRSEVALAVHEALAREGIQVPGSERDVTLVEASEDSALHRTRGGG